MRATLVLFLGISSVLCGQNAAKQKRVSPTFESQGPLPESGATVFPVSPSKPGATAMPSPVLRIDSSLVLIPAHATTPTGAPIVNLTRFDFRLFEDGVEQTIAQFAREERPVSLVIIYDASGSMKNKILRAFESVSELLRSANPKDEFCLVELNGRPRVAVPFTSDTESIRQEAGRSKVAGDTSLLDAIYLAVAEFKHAKNQQKGIVIISDGGDNWSRHSVRSVKRLLVEADAPLFAMGIFESNGSAKYGFDDRNGEQLLDDLAKPTGGRVYAAAKFEDLPAIGERISSALRNEYLLGYHPMNKTRDGKYRYVTLRIGTPASRIRLHYRQGYYALSE